MKEKLIIKNFGPIKDIELELGRFNILIGEQATGKSTVAKVLAVCRYFSYIVKYPDGQNQFYKGLHQWGLSDFIKTDETQIIYECEHYYFSAQHKWRTQIKKTEIDPDDVEYQSFETHLEVKSSEFERLLVEFEGVKTEVRSYISGYKEWLIPTSFFLNEVKALLDNPFYLNVERGLQSIFSLGKSSISNIDDALFNQLAKLDQIARFFKDETLIEPLNITYKNVNGQGFVKSEKHDFIRLANAASGFQSTIPVVLLLKNYNQTKKKGKTFIIEEPEMNLFPDAQQKLMEYLVKQVTTHNNSILITTHSPYVLTPLNNLLYAYQVGQLDEQETEQVIPKKLWLNPAETKAYLMKPDGTCESIMDEEEQLIKADKIDEVTNQINQDFEKLLSIQFVES